MKQRIHIYKFLLIIVLCLGACVDEHVEELSYIQFGVSVLKGSDTRGAIEAEGNFTGNMSLYGLYPGNTHINNETVSVNDGRATSTYTWPGNTALRFYAFANNSGLSVTPNPSSSTLNCAIGSYTIAADASSQKDLLFGWVASHSKSNHAVSFEFQHVLSRITFKAKQEGFPANAEIVIKQLNIKNALNGLSGNLSDAENYNGIFSGWNSSTSNGWNAESSGNRNTVFTMNVYEKFLTTTLDTLTAGTKDDFNMFMFPHNNATLANSGSPVILEIIYEIGGVEKTSTRKLNELESNAHAWGIGQWTSYEITISPTGLLLEAVVQPWDNEESDWYFLNRKLSVSQTEVTITDYNGARVYFSSNMPEVKVLDEVYEGETGDVTAPTNEIFNDLAYGTAMVSGAEKVLTPYRFHYEYDENEKAGSGYVEILADDGINSIGTHTYRIVLAASDSKVSTRQLKREILVNVEQYGVRPIEHVEWGFTHFTGVFFKKNETGERIIMEGNSKQVGSYVGRERWWTAEVMDEAGDWIIISSTPSLDPKIGKSYDAHEQGRAEKYPVTINTRFEWPDKLGGKSQEDGKRVRGRGRIYFRVGTKSTLGNSDENRYARICLKINEGSYPTTNYIYVRQGEAADYIYDRSAEDAIPQDANMSAIAGKTRDAAVRFSPYNLTAPGFKGLAPTNGGPEEVKLPPRGGVAVKYPSQGGAYFQWFSPDADNLGYAYSPNRSLNPIHFNTNVIKSVEKSKYIGVYWDDFAADNELCPPGFHRPSDGPTDEPVANAPYHHTDVNGIMTTGHDYTTQIKKSEFRMSLMANPDAGNGTTLKKGSDGSTPIPENQYIFPSYPYREGQAVALSEASNNYTNYPAISTPPIEGDRSGKINPRYVKDITSLEGFYADGFFDRYPKTGVNAGTWMVKDNSADVAYAGILIFNSRNNHSLFIPYAGRRELASGTPNGFGSAVYLWLASSSPYFNAEYPFLAWRAVLQYRSTSTEIGSVQYRFGQSVRCVADDATTGSDLIMPQ